MIQINSKLLFPSEIEDILIKVPGIKEVCVLGIPRKGSEDELPTAFVVKNGIFDVFEDKIHEAINHLDDYKQLSGGVFFFDSFPKSVSGKILRYKVKANCIEVLQNKK